MTDNIFELIGKTSVKLREGTREDKNLSVQENRKNERLSFRSQENLYKRMSELNGTEGCTGVVALLQEYLADNT